MVKNGHFIDFVIFLLEKDGQLEKFCISNLCKAIFMMVCFTGFKNGILAFSYESANNRMNIFMQISNCQNMLSWMNY